MSLGMSYFQTRSKTKWWGHHAVAKSSVAVGRVTGIALSVPGLWVSLGLCFPLVVTEAVREAAVRVGGVASVTTHSLIHSPAHGGGGGPGTDPSEGGVLVCGAFRGAAASVAGSPPPSCAISGRSSAHASSGTWSRRYAASRTTRSAWSMGV